MSYPDLLRVLTSMPLPNFVLLKHLFEQFRMFSVPFFCTIVMTTFVKPHLNCDLNFLMQSCRKWPQPLLVTQLDFSFVFKLSWATQRPLRVLFIQINALNYTLHSALSTSDIKTLIKD